MGWKAFFTQLLTFIGVYRPIEPPFQTVVVPVGPISVTNGPIIPLLDSFTDCDNPNQDYYDDLVKLSSLTCGLSVNATRILFTKIIGGNDVSIEDYPWQVSLQKSNYFGLNHFCGGSIIHPKWVITAAHCLEWTVMAKSGQQWVIRPDAIKRIRVIAGSQTIKASENSESFDVNKVVIHPSYDTRKGSNDIALIGLKTVIRTMAQNESPINTVCLPNKGEYLSEVVTTTGWGTTAENGADSYNLKAVDLPLVRSSQCKKIYGRDYDIKSMLCAGSQGKDSCQGDSGGPLTQTDETGRATIVGIVSIGNGCGRRGYPGIYTRVSSFSDWITKIINPNPN